MAYVEEHWLLVSWAERIEVATFWKIGAKSYRLLLVLIKSIIYAFPTYQPRRPRAPMLCS